ncbi:MAG: site-specific DNA-methyltransferase [Candidatus Cybelea sp.]|jgi:DNA modification methylase
MRGNIAHHEIATIDIAELRPAPYNPRRISPAAMAALTKSLERFGLVEPIIWNKRSGLVVAGHQRLKILKAKKVRKTSVVVVDLDERSERALNIALNSASLTGTFSDGLEALLEAIQRDDEVLFAQLRFAELLDRVAPRPAGDPNDTPPLPSIATTARGDLYTLGRHRLLCGDSTDAKTVATICAGERVDLMLTDPPYGVDYVGKTRYLAKRGIGTATYRDIASDAEHDYRAWFARFLRVVPWADLATFYIFMSSAHIHDLRLALDDVGLTWGDYLIWVKNTPVLSRKDYNQRTELVAMGFPSAEQQERAEFTVYGWPQRHRFYGGFKRNNVLEYPRPKISKLHPTMKPVEMLQRLMEDGSPTGAVVYEPFCGSGSTIIAAEVLDRRCYAIELDPLYVDVAVQRWEAFTGRKAERRHVT